MASSNPEATARTQRCLQSIQRHTDPPALAVFMLGKEGVGKSSITEKGAGVTGLSGYDRGTETCQIVDTEINGTTYFIVDTPGFHDKESQWRIFCDIASIFDQIRGHAIIAGILFLTPINAFLRQPDTLDRRLYTWLTELCGEDFFPHLTFVTTFWECQVDKYNQRLRSRKQAEWARFVNRGVETYQFGKKYVDGNETDELLQWDVDTDELSNHARELIIRRCCNRSSAVTPLFLQELNAGVHRDATLAAQVFQPASSHSTTNSANSSSTSANRESQQENTNTQGTSTATANQAAAEEESWGWKFGRMVLNTAIDQTPKAVEYVITRQLRGGGAGGAFVFGGNGGPQAMKAQGFDFNSAVDTFKFLGLDSSWDGRARAWRDFGGQGTFTGSKEQNILLKTQAWRRAGH